MHEEPLHLIPPELRARTSRRSTASTSRATSARSAAGCSSNKYDGRIEDVPVGASPSARSTAWASAPSRRPIPRARISRSWSAASTCSTIGEVGVESDPRAYRFDGELNIANRGMMEFIEMLKTDEKFLYVLLTLWQEQNIKTGRFAMIYAERCDGWH